MKTSLSKLLCIGAFLLGWLKAHQFKARNAPHWWRAAALYNVRCHWGVAALLH
jgi:hypothetical protein